MMSTSTANPTCEHLRAVLFERLNNIIDPCSAAMAVPAGLVDMGLLRGLELEALTSGGTRCRIKLCVTHAFCLMSAVFVHEVEKCLRDIPEIEEIDVSLDRDTIWTEELMTPEYRARLEARRQAKNIA